MAMIKPDKTILFIADPLEKLKVKSDTSLAFAQAALESNFAVYWCDATDIMMFGSDVVVANARHVTAVSTTAVKANDPLKSRLPLSQFGHAFVRKDPPFNEEYRDLCWLLAVQNKTHVYNDASALLTFHEKALQWRAFAEDVFSADNLVPTCMTGKIDAIEEFCSRYGSTCDDKFVVKPWMGHGGEDIHFSSTSDDVLRYVKSLNYDLNANKLMVQPFLKNIHSDGDRRVLIAAGEVVGDFVRLPAAGQIESNLAQGGRAESRPMTDKQIHLMKRLAQFLTRHNIGFAGVDLIGERIGEVNITSPTGIRTCEQLTNKPLAKSVFENLVINSGRVL